MKTRISLLCIAAMAAGSILTATEPKESSVSVKFNESDKFTDAASSANGGTDQHYLDMMAAHLKRIADRELAPGQKLEITFTDVDLAGEFIPTNVNSKDVRIIKDIYIPRLTLSFRLLDADGRVVKEGQRKLSDLNFMNNIGLVDRNQPLYYDKALLTDWVRKEFKS